MVLTFPAQIPVREQVDELEVSGRISRHNPAGTFDDALFQPSFESDSGGQLVS